MLNLLGLAIVAAAIAASYVIGKGWSVRRHALRRLYGNDGGFPLSTLETLGSGTGLAQWLAREDGPAVRLP